MQNATDRRLSAIVRHIAYPHAEGHGTVATFEEKRRVINRVKRAQAVRHGILFLLAVAVSL
jgi:hypothetical protein